MSIIADTLQRLQTQTKSGGSDTPDSSSICIPPRGKREPGWHSSPSRGKFWMAGIAMAVGLSGLGLIAYWIGFNLDFGMSTYASLRPGQSPSLFHSSPILRTPPVDSQSSESMQWAIANPVQDLSSPAPQQPEEERSIIQDVASPEPSSPPNTENPLPPTPVVQTPISSEEESRSIAPTPSDPHQEITSTTIMTPNHAAEFPPKKKHSESKVRSANLSAPSFPQSDKSVSKFVKSEARNVTENLMPTEVVLVEERMNTEEFFSNPRQSGNDSTLFPDTTVMIPKKEAPPQTAQAPVPVQLSPINRLRHAQQLIQTGQYKEAVSFLSPLFKDPPINWEPWFWMGTAYLGEGNLEQADQFFLSGLARNDKIPQLWIQRALVAHQQGKYQVAIHELRHAESLDATLPHTHLNMGYAYEKLGNDRLANEYYGKFLKLSEGNPEFFSIRKKLYARFTEQVYLPPLPGLSSSIPENP